MRTVFADTSYWIALLNPRDQHHQRAMLVTSNLQAVSIMTSEAVLIEFLNHFAKSSSYMKRAVAKQASALLVNLEVKVVMQTPDIFHAALALYESRLDKGYSLTDCISMNVMREQGTTDVLTSDNHFGQEGFNVLL